MTSQWFQQSISSLSNDSLRSQVLSEIKLALGTLNNGQIQQISHNLSLNEVFDCLNCSEKDQVELTSDVLGLLLAPLEFSFVLRQYGAQLVRALGHPVARVKEMVIKEFLHATSGDSAVLLLCQEEELLLGLVDCINHEDLAVSTSSVALLIKLGKTTIGQRVLYSNPVLQRLKEAMSRDAVVKFRVYEVSIELSIHSAQGLTASQSSGLLSELLGELSGRDILVQLNAIDLLTKLALTSHGLQHLEAQGIIRALAQKLVTVESDPLAALLLPGLIKFFGNVAQACPEEIFSHYPMVVAVVFTTLDDSDLIVRGVAVETIGYIGSTLQGKVMLKNQGKAMTEAVKKIGGFITNLATEWQIKSLNAVASLVQLKPEEQSPDALGLTESWFNLISKSPVDLVMNVAKLPFPELRLAGLRVLGAISDQPWGRVLIHSSPGLVEYLVNRSLEPDKTCKDVKFEIVKTILAAPDVQSVLSNEELSLLRAFVKEGPYFVLPVSEVVLENASA